MQFCKDCKHSSRVWAKYTCYRPLALAPDPVIGRANILDEDCHAERQREWRGWLRRERHCGPNAIFFEPKAEPRAA